MGHRHHRLVRGHPRGGRRQHRQRRAPLHARQPRRDALGNRLGLDQLLDRQRHRHPALGVARAALRQKALLHFLARRLRARVDPVRSRHQPDAAHHRPHRPGARRRRAHREGPGADVRDRPARGTGEGEHHLLPRRHRRARHRSRARRLSDRQLRLALDFLHQHSARHHGRVHGQHLSSAGRSARAQKGHGRLAGHPLPRARARRVPDRAGAGPAGRLVFLRLHPAHGAPERRRPRAVHLAGIAHRASRGRPARPALPRARRGQRHFAGGRHGPLRDRLRRAGLRADRAAIHRDQNGLDARTGRHRLGGWRCSRWRRC